MVSPCVGMVLRSETRRFMYFREYGDAFRNIRFDAAQDATDCGQGKRVSMPLQPFPLHMLMPVKAAVLNRFGYVPG